MTIYTSTTVEKKVSDEKLPSIVFISGSKEVEVSKGVSDEPDGFLLEHNSRNEAVLASMQKRRRHRLMSMLVCSIGLLTFCFLGLALLKFIYTRMVHEEYRMTCGVTFEDDYGHHQFEEQIMTDARTHEQIDVPEMGDFRRATILHDFETNHTAIVDVVNRNCFVKPLNWATTQPPSDFWDLVRKLKTGYYMPNEEQVKSEFRVAGGPVRDATMFGYYIARHCYGYDTYELEPIPHANGAVKRAACERLQVRVFSGIKLEMFNIYQC